MGKATDEHGGPAPIQATAPFDFIRVDTVTHKNPGHLGYRYSVHIVDARSNYHWVKFSQTKNGCFNNLRDFAEMIETQTGRKIKMIGLDGGSEFSQATHPFWDSHFNAWARSKGIVCLRTPPHTPWMNGKVERAAQEILEKSRSTIIAYKIPERLWPFVMETVVQVVHLLPTGANPDRQSPQQRFATALNMPVEARQPYIRHLRNYFCEAFYYIKPQKRVDSEKFTPRAHKGRLIGYADLHGKIYWIWNPVTDEVVRASAVRFNEGPDLTADSDVLVEYEAVFDDEAEEEEEVPPTITIIQPSGEEQPQQPPAPSEPPVLSEPHPQTPVAQSPAEPLSDPADDSAFDWHSAEEDDVCEPALLPSPAPTSAPAGRTDSAFDDSDLQDIYSDGPIPADHILAPYTGHMIQTPSSSMRGSVAPSTPVGGSGEPSSSVGGSEEHRGEPPSAVGRSGESSSGADTSSRPRRSKAKYGTGQEDGYYAKLAKGKLPGQNLYTAHLVEPEPPDPVVEYTLSHIKVEHDIETSRRADLPQNYRQASRLPNFEEYWLPAMQQQDRDLVGKDVYDLVRKRPGMKVLPSKWVFDEKVDLVTGNTTARARWVVCGNFDQGSWNSQDLYAAVVNSVTIKVFLPSWL